MLAESSSTIVLMTTSVSATTATWRIAAMDVHLDYRFEH